MVEVDVSDLIRDREFSRGALALVDADSLNALLDGAVGLLVRRAGAREVYVELLIDDAGTESSRIAVEGCSSERVDQIKTFVSRGIIGEATATGRTVETANALLDPRFFELESVRRHRIEAVLCAPIGREQALGVIYLQGSASGASFGEAVRADVELLAQMIALAASRLYGQRPSRRRGEARGDDPFSGIVCKSAALREVVDELRFAAPLDVHILLTGPSGSGKTQLAAATHAASKRRAGPFVELNCATVPESLLESELFGAEPGAHVAVPRRGLRGKVEMAEGGTLFLDDIGELPLLAQPKILQLLQSKTYYPLGSPTPRQADIRVIAATSLQLKQAIADKRFREDLYFRLKVLEVKVPSLAERLDDIAPLARHFLRLAVERHDLGHKELSPGALSAVQAVEWVGNVRELAHRIEAAALNAERRASDRVERHDVFVESEASEGPLPSLHQATRAFQRKHVAAALQATNFNMTETARMLDISRAHLYTMVRTLDLKAR